MQTYHVVVYGSSLYLDGITEGLHLQSGVLVTQVAPQTSGALLYIRALAPDVVLMERTLADTEFALDLMNLNIPVMTISLEDNYLTISVTRHIPVTSLSDLFQIVQNIATATESWNDTDTDKIV